MHKKRMLIVPLLGNFIACTREKYIPMVYFEVQVRDRVVRIYRTSRHTHARMNRNERSWQSRSRVESGPPSPTGLTGPRVNLDRTFLRCFDWVYASQKTHGVIIVFVATSLLIQERNLARLRPPERRRQGTSAPGSTKATST